MGGQLTVLYSAIITITFCGNIMGASGLGRILFHNFSEQDTYSGLDSLQYIIDDKHLQIYTKIRH